MKNWILCFILTPLLLIGETFYIFLGAPGAGKGTQSSLLKRSFSIPHISVGDLFREHVKNNSPLGLRAKEYMERGELVPTSLALEMLFERLSDPSCKEGAIIDGSSRTLEQAQLLVQQFSSSSDYVAILFDVPDETALSRIEGRLLCSKCSTPFHSLFSPPQIDNICDACGGTLVQRSDDKGEVAERRIEIYRESDAAVNHFYEQRNKLIRLDATQPPNQLFEQLRLILLGRQVFS